MNALVQYRNKRKISQSQFASLIGITQSVLSRFETGRATPSLETAVRIQEQTGGKVPVQTWLAGRDKAPTDGAAA